MQALRFADLPALAQGETQEWANAEPRIVRDGISGEWLIMRLSAADQSTLNASSDGRVWRSIPSRTNASCVGSCSLPLQVMSMAQDSLGALHLLVRANDYAGPLREYYGRLSLARSAGGAISAYQLDVLVPLPPHGRSMNTLTDLRGELQVVRFDGHESLMYLLSVTTFSSLSTRDIKVFIGRAQTLTPSSVADFVGLEGRAGDSLVFDSCAVGAQYCDATPALLSTHNQTAQFAQVGSTGDLLLFIGPIEADYGNANDPATQPEANRLRMKRLAWDSSSKTWSPTQPFVTLADTDGRYLPLLLDAAGSGAGVWLLWLSPLDGIHVTVFDAQGRVQELASPETLRHYSGWGVLNVAADGSKAWAIWNLCTNDNSTPAFDCTEPHTAEAKWEGGSWTVAQDPVATGDNSGLVGATGLSDGAAAVLFRGTLLRNSPPVPQFAEVR